MKFSAVFVSFVLASVASAIPIPSFGGIASFNPFQGGAGSNPFASHPMHGKGKGHGGQSNNNGQSNNSSGKGQNNNSGNGQNNNNSGKGQNNGSSGKGQNNNGNGGNAVGAAYFISNEPSGNMIIASNIAQDGTLSFGNAIATGGAGAHGLADLSGPDPLFAQGAIKVSAAAQMLATVNPGSNTVSLFSIDPNDPSNLSMVGFPISSEGEFPMSLAFDKEGKKLCVLNGGAVNGVMCYDVDAKNGLIPKANTLRSLGLNQTTPATGPAGTTSHIIFSEDGSKLHASVKGVPPTPGFIASFDVDSDGSLSSNFTPSVPGKGGLLPFSMTIIPGKDAILATDAGVGFDIFDFKQGLVASDDSSVIPIDGQKATCWSSFSKKTGNFYLTDIGTSEVTEVNVDDNLKGSIVQQIPQGDGTASIDNDVASVGNNDFLYVLLANATTVSVSSLDAPGKVTPVQKFKFDDAAKAAGVQVNAANVQGMTTFVKA